MQHKRCYLNYSILTSIPFQGELLQGSFLPSAMGTTTLIQEHSGVSSSTIGSSRVPVNMPIAVDYRQRNGETMTATAETYTTREWTSRACAM